MRGNFLACQSRVACEHVVQSHREVLKYAEFLMVGFLSFAQKTRSCQGIETQLSFSTRVGKRPERESLLG